MKILIRSTLVVTCLFVLALTLGALGTNPAARAGAEVDTADLAPTAPTADLPALELEDPVDLAGCSASTTCSDGSTLSCTGGFGDICQESSEPCTVADCDGVRNFVQCGTTKKVCSSCDIGSCQPCTSGSCPAGALCRSNTECGACGACIDRRCVCISPN